MTGHLLVASSANTRKFLAICTQGMASQGSDEVRKQMENLQ
jgi:hypothetical protein